MFFILLAFECSFAKYNWRTILNEWSNSKFIGWKRWCFSKLFDRYVHVCVCLICCCLFVFCLLWIMRQNLLFMFMFVVFMLFFVGCDRCVWFVYFRFVCCFIFSSSSHLLGYQQSWGTLNGKDYYPSLNTRLQCNVQTNTNKPNNKQTQPQSKS